MQLNVWVPKIQIGEINCSTIVDPTADNELIPYWFLLLIRIPLLLSRVIIRISLARSETRWILRHSVSVSRVAAFENFLIPLSSLHPIIHDFSFSFSLLSGWYRELEIKIRLHWCNVGDCNFPHITPMKYQSITIVSHVFEVQLSKGNWSLFFPRSVSLQVGEVYLSWIRREFLITRHYSDSSLCMKCH